MLRILVISLFVANLLLLGFQSSKPAARTETAVARTVAKDPGIPTIHLFSEMMEDQDLLSGSRQCFTLGPFHESGDKDDVRSLLQDVSTRIGERQTEALVEKGYWVFMPPFASLLEANQELISLQALGLDDIGIMYDGEWKNAISLGYFLRQENALRRKKDLEERGYEPLIRVQRQAEPRFWLDYEQIPGSGRLALDMRNRPNDFMQRPVPCPEDEALESMETESLEPVEVTAQLQTRAEQGDTVAGQSAGQDISAVIESAVEEPVEEQANRDVEIPAEEVPEESPEQRVENQPGRSVGTGPEAGVGDNPEQPTATETANTDDTETAEG